MEVPRVASSISFPQIVAPEPVDVLIAGGGVSVGFSLSFTSIVWVAVAVFALASVASQLIVVIPSGYGSVSDRPSLRAPVRITLGQLSSAVVP